MHTIVCNSSQINTVIFDLDGTIADTNEIILRTMAETLEHASGRPWPRELLMPNWGMRLRDQMQLLYPEINLDRAVPFYRRRYAELHETLLAEFPGVRPMLQTLASQNIVLGVVTSKKRDSAQKTLCGLGYAHFFTTVVVEEDTSRHKPSPEPILYALERLRAPATQTIYVGDNPDDIHAAHAAGIGAVAVGWALRPRAELSAARPEAIIDTPGELLTLLDAGAVAAARA
ncbi:MAG TPA: HAD-IA family hydrolase [Armatimonadota bacterium]